MTRGEENVTDRVVCVASFTDPVQEPEKLREFYESLAEARRETGEAPVPFHPFADLVREQVRALRRGDAGDVAFRVAVKEGKVSLTARVLKGASSEGG